MNSKQVTMYTCGPTVYNYQHIGNYRTFVLSDLLFRTLKYNDYPVNYVMNITDVGHLTGDNLGDANTGDDRMEAAASKEGKSVKDIAEMYTNAFISDTELLNIEKPTKFTKATNYISEQIELVKVLENNGFTYKISDGIYFDTSKFPRYKNLLNVSVGSAEAAEKDAAGEEGKNVETGARIKPNPEKRNSSDFALWKFSPQDSTRWQEWESPWGKGFPGWHVECSAMSMKELGPSIDLHLGGEDHMSIHHPNEIAQSECATGKKFVNYWLHGAHLKVDDGKMGKSLGNAYTLQDIQDKKFNVLALRYFYFGAHYRNPLNFTWEALDSSQKALKRIYDLVSSYKEDSKASVSKKFKSDFTDAINNDLNMPQALAVVWELLKSDLKESTKLATLLDFDEVLGLNFKDHIGVEVPKKVQDLAKTRMQYRNAGIWDKADAVRREIALLGFIVEDTSEGFKLRAKK